MVSAEDENVAEWLQNMAQFAGTFFTRYTTVDMVGIFTYLLNRMRVESDFA